MCLILGVLVPWSGVKWLMSIQSMQQVGQTQAMHVNVCPVILIKPFTGQNHLLA